MKLEKNGGSGFCAPLSDNAMSWSVLIAYVVQLKAVYAAEEEWREERGGGVKDEKPSKTHSNGHKRKLTTHLPSTFLATFAQLRRHRLETHATSTASHQTLPKSAS